MAKLTSLAVIALCAAAPAFAQAPIADNPMCRELQPQHPTEHVVLLIKGSVAGMVDCGKVTGQAIDRLVFVSVAAPEVALA